MKLQWLREMSLAAHFADLKSSLERLAGELVGGEAAYLDYQTEGWCLTRHETRLSLEENTLAGRCAMAGSSLNEANKPVLASGKSWPNVTATPVRRFGSLIGVLLTGSQASAPPEIGELVETFALLAEPFSELDRARQALGQFQNMTVAAVEATKAVPDGHVAGICQLTADLAEYLDLSPQAKRRLWSAALYHDVGSLLLHREGSAEASRTHPKAGAQFLEATGVYRELAPFVATHHERHDGTGYPEGLKGDALSIDQWVLCLAEDFQEFWELNPHLGFEVKLGIFFQEKASAHHPDVLDALAGLVDSGRLDRLRVKAEAA